MTEEKTQVVKLKEPFYPTNDAFFKSVFRSIEARGVVANFLNAVTGIPKEKLMNADYVGGEHAIMIETEKNKTSDVIVKLSEEEKIIVEMNKKYKDNQFTKNTEYAFTVKVESTKSSKKYSKIFLINIDNYNYFKTKEPLLHFKLRDEFGHIENESYNSIHLILENLVNVEYNKNIDERIIKFAQFLKTNTIKEMVKRFKGDEDYMSAIRKVEDLSTDPDFIGYYDIEEAHEQDIEDALATGVRQGIEQGIASNKIETAKNMLSKNIDLSIISECTSLPISEIESLSNNINEKI